MGRGHEAARRRRVAAGSGTGPLIPQLAQVVPAIPSFNVDDGFTYLVPERLDVRVGSIVRVKLAGRRVRGYVVGLRTGETAGLKEIDAVSGDLEVFDDRLLTTLRWAAAYYVAPMSVVLAKAAPANLPRCGASAGAGRRAPFAVTAHSGGRPHDLMMSLFGHGGLLVLTPTVVEAHQIADAAAGAGTRLVVTAGAGPAATTRGWVRARVDPGAVVIATREAAWWPVPEGRVLVVDEARAAMQDKQTPTVQAGEVIRRRALVERLNASFWSPAPSLRLAAHGLLPEPPSRPWPQVEIIDRRIDSSLLPPPTVAAVRAVLRRGGRVFLFARSRRFAPALRCARCGELRRCRVCTASLPAAGECPRCGAGAGACTACSSTRAVPIGVGAGRLAAELGRHLDPEAVGDAGGAAPVVVGTERDLPRVGEVDLAVVVDADGLLGAPHYQAEEQALHLMCRIARLTRRGRRSIVQSFQPEHRVLEALRTARPADLVASWLQERERDGLPPRGELVVLQVERAPQGVGDEVVDLAGPRAAVHHLHRGSADRWIVQGPELRAIKLGLRGLVQEWRDAGARVRVDVDPRRL